jgi:hypothetical protein
MNEVKFNSQICTTKEQSQHLLDLGLKPETADMCIDLYYEDKPFVVLNKIDYSKQTEFVPAWSLHRLLEMYVERYISCNVNLKELTFDWLINEIEIHITENDFNKEYLKQ